MNHSKFSLGDVITLVVALAFSFVCFLSMNFYSLGETGSSAISATIIFAFLFGTAFAAKLLKRTKSNFSTCIIGEYFFLTIFTLFFAFFSYSTFPHYFNVTAKKKEIQDKIQQNITQAQKMFAEYEQYATNREMLYKKRLTAAVYSKSTNPTAYKKYGFINNSVSDMKQIETKMFTVHADLFPTNYSDIIYNNGIKEVAISWLQDAQKITNSWKPIGIVGVVNTINKNSNTWLNTLVQLSTVRETGEEASDFAYELSFSDIKKEFTKESRPNMLTFTLSVLAYLFMLLSWFVTKRDSRSIGAQTTAVYEVEL